MLSQRQIGWTTVQDPNAQPIRIQIAVPYSGTTPAIDESIADDLKREMSWDKTGDAEEPWQAKVSGVDGHLLRPARKHCGRSDVVVVSLNSAGATISSTVHV